MSTFPAYLPRARRSGRPPLAPGMCGNVRIREVRPGTFRAESGFKDGDGVRRNVSAQGTSRAEAERNLRHRVEARIASGTRSLGYVYAIAAGEFVKFGHSVDPWKRLLTIRRAASGVVVPEGLDTSGAGLVAIAPGGRNAEEYAHWELRGERSAGEWFAAPRGGATRAFLHRWVGDELDIDRLLDAAADGEDVHPSHRFKRHSADTETADAA